MANKRANNSVSKRIHRKRHECHQRPSQPKRRSERLRQLVKKVMEQNQINSVTSTLNSMDLVKGGQERMESESMNSSQSAEKLARFLARDSAFGIQTPTLSNNGFFHGGKLRHQRSSARNRKAVVSQEVLPVDSPEQEWTNANKAPCRVVNIENQKSWVAKGRFLTTEIIGGDSELFCWNLTGSMNGSRVYVFAMQLNDVLHYVKVGRKGRLVLDTKGNPPSGIDVDNGMGLKDDRCFYVEDDLQVGGGVNLIPVSRPGQAVTESAGGKLVAKEKDARNTIKWQILSPP